MRNLVIVAKLSGIIEWNHGLIYEAFNDDNLKVKTAALTPSGEWLYTVLQVWPPLLNSISCPYVISIWVMNLPKG